MHVCMHIHVCVHVYVCMEACMYVIMFVRIMYGCIYVHIFSGGERV